MNAASFFNLKKLKMVWMQSNICINDYFSSQTEISSIGKIVDDNCGVCRGLENSADCKIFTKIREMEIRNSNALSDLINRKIEALEIKIQNV